jgi:hypothetical protein
MQSTVRHMLTRSYEFQRRAPPNARHATSATIQSRVRALAFQTHLSSGGPWGRYASQQNVMEQELQLRGEAVPAHIKQGVGEAQGP